MHMMHDLAIARPDLGRAHPFAFGEICRDEEMLVSIGAGLHHEIFANIDHDVRFPLPPAFDEDRRRWQFAWVSFHRASVYPGFDRFDFAAGQPGVVSEAAVMSIGE